MSTADRPKQMCEAGDWTHYTKMVGDCPNEATTTEFWFDEEALEVHLCDKHSGED